MLARWRLARAATKLHTVLLDVTELTEHADNAIKFLSDMFSARLYKLAAAKVGVPDYKNLVDAEIADGRGTLSIHGRSVSPESRVCAGTDGGGHPDYRPDLFISREKTTLGEKSRHQAKNADHAVEREKRGW